MAFAMFFLAEYANIILVSALAVGHVPRRLAGAGLVLAVGMQTPAGSSSRCGSGTGSGCSPRPSSSRPCSCGSRATFPRFRYDQIMRLGWKIFIPVTLVWLVVVGLVDPVALEHLEVEADHGDRQPPIKRFPVELHAHRALQGHAADRPPFPRRARSPIQYPEEKTPLVAALPRPARAAPLRERRGALHRLQAVRGGLPGAGDHDRERRARRRHAPDDALRHRPDQVHLLRLLRGELPGRLDRRDPHPRVPRREARRPVLHQGHAAGRRRPLRERDRRGEATRRDR